MPPLSPPPSSALDLGLALRDGWAAFRRAPWTLSGFMLLITALAIGLLLLESALTPTPGELPGLPSPALPLCRLASALLGLWGMVGLLTYAQVSQHFLVQLAALEGSGPLHTLQRGRSAVDRRWWTVLALLGVESLLLLAGMLAMVVGLFVAVPLVVCISTAAYRQLFGAAGATGVLPGPAA
jgi:hypothetical protein